MLMSLLKSGRTKLQGAIMTMRQIHGPSRFKVYDVPRPSSCPRPDLLDEERDRWFLWVPVFFGIGIGGYFAYPVEPPIWPLIAGLVVVLALRAFIERGTQLLAITGALVCVIVGCLAGALRTEWTRAPVLVAPVTAKMAAGFVEVLEPRRPNGVRITLRLKALQSVPDDERPDRIRFIWASATSVAVGDPITVRVSLRPPPIPVRPGGYDFARRAWFQRIGGVGFAVSPPLRSRTLPTRPDLLGLRKWLGGIRTEIGRRVNATVPGERAAIINALIIGERGRVPEEKLEHLRRSGLSHMLAISGLHMAMIAGALFWLLRGGLAAVPGLALNREIKKVAAVIALFGGVGYFAVSGASVATQRAAIMIGLMLVAVLLDRPAISLRNVAIAALIILAIAPENLLEIGFQMSFAAVVALVAFYEWWQSRARSGEKIKGNLIQNPALLFALNGSRNMIVGTLMTTFIAGLAVAPFGAFHFHKVAQLSLLSNLLAMPIFTIAVMPMALVTLVTLLTLPFGLEAGSLTIMAWGVDQVTGIAAWVSEQPNAVYATTIMSSGAFVMIVLGGLWLCLWQRRWRFLGLIPLAVGLGASTQALPPDLLIAREGQVVAARTDGALLSGSPGRAGAFELTRWLQADGDVRTADTLVRGKGFNCDAAGCTTRIRGVLVALPKTPANLADDCRHARIVILVFDQAQPCPSARLIVDRKALEEKGVHAVSIREGGDIQLVTVADTRGARPWTRKGRQNEKRRRSEEPRRLSIPNLDQ